MHGQGSDIAYLALFPVQPSGPLHFRQVIAVDGATSATAEDAGGADLATSVRLSGAPRHRTQSRDRRGGLGTHTSVQEMTRPPPGKYTKCRPAGRHLLWKRSTSRARHDAVAPKETVCWKAADQLAADRGVGGMISPSRIMHRPHVPGGAWPLERLTSS